jgi:hypothetical protein
LKEDFQQMENDSNMLIISGNKKSNKIDDKNGQVTIKKKKLSRKERIKLEKIVERKNKSSRVS